MQIGMWAMNVAAAAWIAFSLIGPVEGRLSAGHAEAAYRGWRIAQARCSQRWTGVDPRIDAGQPFALGLEINGPIASLGVGSRAGGPDTAGYRFALRAAIVAVPVLTAVSSLVAGTAYGWLTPWLAVATFFSRPNTLILDQGFLELATLGSIGGLYLSGLRRFHRDASLIGWCAIAGSCLLGWACSPLMWLAFCLPATIGWLVVASRHGWIWHLTLLLAFGAGLTPTIPLAPEIGRNWLFMTSVVRSELQRLWTAFDESTTRFGLWLIVQSAIAAGPWLAARAARGIAWGSGFAVICLALVRVSGSDFAESANPAHAVWKRPTSIVSDEPTWWSGLVHHLDGSARMLVEGTQPTQATDGGFSVVLAAETPVLIGSRCGGDSLPWALVESNLGGRPIGDWTDDELSRLADRWNIGWIMARHPATRDRLNRLPQAIRLPLPDRPDGVVVYSLNRRRSFFLVGSGRSMRAEDGSLVLEDVNPDRGVVVVSLRFHPGWTVSPSRISLECEIDPYDSHPIVRLRPGGPFGRVILHPSGH